MSFTPCYGWCVNNVPSSLLKTQEWMILHFTFYFGLSFLALLSTEWVSLNLQKWKILHFAFYTLLHPMGHNSIRNNYDSRVNCFTFYIVLFIRCVQLIWYVKIFINGCFSILHFTPCYGRCVTNVPSSLLKTQELMILHFTFYFVIYFLLLLIKEDSILNGFTFYIWHRAILSCVVINWLVKFELSKMDAFTFCLLHLNTSHGLQLFHWL